VLSFETSNDSTWPEWANVKFIASVPSKVRALLTLCLSPKGERCSNEGLEGKVSQKWKEVAFVDEGIHEIVSGFFGLKMFIMTQN
jgi:hypothetical protein